MASEAGSNRSRRITCSEASDDISVWVSDEALVANIKAKAAIAAMNAVTLRMITPLNTACPISTADIRINQLLQSKLNSYVSKIISKLNERKDHYEIDLLLSA